MIWLGVLLALGTSISWAFGNVFMQRVGKIVGAPRAMVWSLASGGLLATPFAVVLDTRAAPITTAVIGWTVAAAIAGVVAYVGLFFAFANEELTITVPIVSSWALVTGVISVTLLGESLAGARLVGAGAVLTGVILVSIPKRAARAATESGAASRRAIPAALAASGGFGVMIPAMGRIAPATGAFGATAIVDALGIAIVLIIGAVVKIDLRAPPREAWRIVFATGLAETSGFVTVAFARRFAPMTLVAPVASLAAMLTILYAWVALGERPRPLAIAGALVAAVGIVMLAT